MGGEGRVRRAVVGRGAARDATPTRCSSASPTGRRRRRSACGASRPCKPAGGRSDHVEALQLLPQLRRLPRAHRPQPEGPDLRVPAGAPLARRRRAASRPEFRKRESAGARAGAGGRRARCSRSRSRSSSTSTKPGPSRRCSRKRRRSGRGCARSRRRSRARSIPLNNTRVLSYLTGAGGAERRREERVVPPLDRGGLPGARSAARGRSRDRAVLPRRRARPGGLLPGAADGQRAALQVRPRAVPDARRDRRELPALDAFQRAAPERQPDAE